MDRTHTKQSFCFDPAFYSPNAQFLVYDRICSATLNVGMHIAHSSVPSVALTYMGWPWRAANRSQELQEPDKHRVPFARRTPDFCNPRLLECAPITRIPTLYRLSHGAGKRRPHKHLAHKRLAHKHVCVSGLWTPTMDFRPCETLLFCDNFLTLGLIGFNFSHESFQLKRQFLSIWFVNKKLKFRGPVIDS